MWQSMEVVEHLYESLPSVVCVPVCYIVKKYKVILFDMIFMIFLSLSIIAVSPLV